MVLTKHLRRGVVIGVTLTALALPISSCEHVPIKEAAAVGGGVIGYKLGGGWGALGGGLGGYGLGMIIENQQQRAPVQQQRRAQEYEKFCPECGRQYNIDKKFCPYDGTQLRHRR